jgi:hypothetical protein
VSYEPPTAQPPGPVSTFLIRLTRDKELYAAWTCSRRAALALYNRDYADEADSLSDDDRSKLENCDFPGVRDKVQAEYSTIDRDVDFVPWTCPPPDDPCPPPPPPE